MASASPSLAPAVPAAALAPVHASKSSAWQNAKPFVNGGLAGCIGLTIMQPVDLVKVRIQLGQGSLGQVVRSVMQSAGPMGFFNGWSAQMARQVTYGTIRLGLFQWLRDTFARDKNGKTLPLSFPFKVALGLASGTAGAIIGNPAEVSLIRMQADKMLPVAEQRNYRNVFSAIWRIASQEGVPVLFRGCGPTVLRAACLNGSSLACYDQTKEAVDAKMGTKNGVVAICSAAWLAGTVAAATSMPFDYVKTQIQQMKPGPDGKMPFAGMTDCALQTLSSKGVTGFYVGFPVYVGRIAPAIAIIFFALESVIHVEKKLGVF
jgi:solute carrier family 25 oxoglutarate transporter 11